jgi:hypothetical protein
MSAGTATVTLLHDVSMFPEPVGGKKKDSDKKVNYFSELIIEPMHATIHLKSFQFFEEEKKILLVLSFIIIK